MDPERALRLDRLGDETLVSDANLPEECHHVVRTLLQSRRSVLSQEQQPLLTVIRNICWVAHRDFSIEVGKQQIAEYIQTWEMDPRWLYGLEFLGRTEMGRGIFYHYQARWSTPTPQRPILGTASVYFVVDVQRAKPQSLPVEVHFVVESTRLVHTAGRTRFREKWLVDIIKCKAALRRQVDF